MNTKYQPVIGLEVHIELSTKSKMFCTCSADYFTADPNTHVCPVCLGLPGAMPHANKRAIELAQLFGLALNCQLQSFSKFDRKNYFYPDLAKGFQISQYDLPFSQNGQIEIEVNGKKKKIRITRVHLEEDTGKLTHTKIEDHDVTLIDFNRSGVPLLEIVTQPDIQSSQEAKSYAQKSQQIARYLDISDADMEKGSMRIEPNVSLRKVREVRNVQKVSQVSEVSQELPSYKVELKNINSFRFAEKAIEYEIKRQAEILEAGKIPEHETRGWNEAKQQTVSQRSKEFAHDYRYFPEPDLPPLDFNSAYLKKLKLSLSELPDAKHARFKNEFKLPDYDIEILTRDSKVATFFEEAVKVGNKHGIGAKRIANEVINKKPDVKKTLPAEFVLQIYKASQIVTIAGDELDKIIDEVLNKNPRAVEDYKKGKQNAIMFLVGQVIRKIPQKVEPNLIKMRIEESFR